MKVARKKSIIILLVALGLLSLTAGMFMLQDKKIEGNMHNASSVGKFKVATTIFPLYDIVKTVGGEKVDVKLVLPLGASPHTFEVTPGQVKDFQSVQVFFTIGHGIDDWTNDIATSVDGAEVFAVDENISLMPFEHKEGESEHEGSEDPHYWLSPNNAEQISKNVAEKLAEIDPENADYYKKNSEDFISQLETREKQWQEKIAVLDKRDIVVFHNAWGYFAKEFVFNVVTSFEPFPGKSPSPQYLADFQNEVMQSNIKTLFVEPQFSENSISTLAKDLGVSIEVIDPIGGVSGRESYIDLIDFNVNVIYKALK
jgi:zinc transport system substrate-binding protein